MNKKIKFILSLVLVILCVLLIGITIVLIILEISGNKEPKLISFEIVPSCELYDRDIIIPLEAKLVAKGRNLTSVKFYLYIPENKNAGKEILAIRNNDQWEAVLDQVTIDSVPSSHIGISVIGYDSEGNEVDRIDFEKTAFLPTTKGCGPECLPQYPKHCGSPWETFRHENLNYEISFPLYLTLQDYEDKKIISYDECYASYIGFYNNIVQINNSDNTFDSCMKEKSLSIDGKDLSSQLTELGWPEEIDIAGKTFFRRYSEGEFSDEGTRTGEPNTKLFSYQTFYNNKCYNIGVGLLYADFFGLDGFKDKCPLSLKDSTQYKTIFEQEHQKVQDIFFPILSTFKFID